jgi:predicted CXXCH cytochrome family protein
VTRRAGSKWPERAIILSALSVLLLMSACSQETRYRVLSLFLDGVPPPGAETTAADSSVVEIVAPLPVVVAAPPSPPQTVLYQHGPFAANQCNTCHDLGGMSLQFREMEEVEGLVDEEGGGESRLQVSPDKLCFYCHQELDPVARPDFNYHGPVAAGECRQCHHPHKSLHPYQLLASPPDLLCKQCHDDESLGTPLDHEDQADCLDCHDPHRSTDEYLLR